MGSDSASSVGIIVGIIVALVIYVITVIGMWKMFKKMGAAGILSLIPIVNVFVLYHYVRGHAAKALLLLIPVFGEIYGIITNFKIAKAFGKGVGFGFGIWFLPEIFMNILGFGKAEYQGPC